jgi:hypothetical protein
MSMNQRTLTQLRNVTPVDRASRSGHPHPSSTVYPAIQPALRDRTQQQGQQGAPALQPTNSSWRYMPMLNTYMVAVGQDRPRQREVAARGSGPDSHEN